MLTSIVRRQLTLLLEREDHRIDLAHAALLIAQEEYPDLRPGRYLRELDALAHRVRQHATAAGSVREIVEEVNHVLFVQEGFRGNAEDYYDPRNSFLNQVMQRKLGIPITLSIIYIAIGRRLGLPVVGLGLPGHFIVGIQADERILIDPFNRGAILTLDDCAARVRAVYGDRLTFHPRMLAPVSTRQILIRMLNNLKAIYAQSQDPARLLAAIDRLLLLDPGDVHELRDRGIVCQHLKFYGQALADLNRYVDAAPRAMDADKIRGVIRSIEREMAWQN